MSRAPQGWSEQRTLLTRDGVRISAAARLPASGRTGEHSGAGGSRLAYVVAHGFSGTWRSSGLNRVTERLATGPGAPGVVGFDFRGHGRSGGVSTVGDREIWDVDAAVGWARLLGFDQVATVGFSMGASVVVRHAALVGGVDAVVAVSGPSRWFYKGTPAMRRLHLVIERPAGRLVARTVLGTRIVSQRWDPLPEEPRAVAGRIAPTPFLIVHGDKDAYFPLDHPRQLAEAAGPTAQLWVEPGFGHAEAAIGPDLVDRIGAWVREAVAGRADATRPGGSRPGCGRVVMLRYWAAAKQAAASRRSRSGRWRRWPRCWPRPCACTRTTGSSRGCWAGARSWSTATRWGPGRTPSVAAAARVPSSRRSRRSPAADVPRRAPGSAGAGAGRDGPGALRS